MLSKDFFAKPTLIVAKSLLGCKLIHETRDGKVSGVITETEAYLHDDPASHSFNGKTKRNSPMFGEPGTAYIYFTYGMHYCFNVVTNKKGIGEAVLLRAVKPIEGIEIMKKNRGILDEKNLTNGPAKLVQAFKIKKEQNGISLLRGKLRIEKYKRPKKIIQTKRIGISKGKDLPHRFLVEKL